MQTRIFNHFILFSFGNTDGSPKRGKSNTKNTYVVDMLVNDAKITNYQKTSVFIVRLK